MKNNKLSTSLTALIVSANILFVSCSADQVKRIGLATGIGCAGGLALGAIADEMKRTSDKKKKKQLQNQAFGILDMQKKKPDYNKGKLVGLGVGCAAGLGVGLYLDMMHRDMEKNFATRGMKLEKVAGEDGETKELLVKMDGNISFASGKADLQGVAADNTAKVSEALAAYPDTKVKIGGHTDGTGNAAANKKLSEERAEAVAKILKEKGIPASRIADVEGYGNTMPLPGTDANGNVPDNRRVDISIIPKK